MYRVYTKVKTPGAKVTWSERSEEEGGLSQNDRIQLSDARGAHISDQGRGSHTSDQGRGAGKD